MYIMRKLLSTARPDMKRDNENIGKLVEKTVTPFPMSAITLANINTGNRPKLSAKVPKICVPTTEPTKNMDCPIVDL